MKWGLLSWFRHGKGWFSRYQLATVSNLDSADGNPGQRGKHLAHQITPIHSRHIYTSKDAWGRDESMWGITLSVHKTTS